MQVRLLFAEDMIKKQFVQKTLEILSEICLVNQLEIHVPSEEGDVNEGKLSYGIF